MPKYVVSSTLTDPPWNTTVLGENWPEEVARLRKELDGEILVYGSRRLSRALIEMGLVDEVRSTDPILLLIGSPMGAAGFGTLAQHFTDRTVVAYDPRGSERSKRTDGATQNTVEEHAEDLHRLISAIDAGPVDLFASSGAR